MSNRQELNRKYLFNMGIFFILMVSSLMVFVVSITSENNWLEDRILIKGQLFDANNLKDAGVIQFRGINIGKVLEMKFNDQRSIDLKLSVEKRYLKLISQKSYLEISSKGIVGDKVLEIVTPEEATTPFDTNTDILLQRKQTELDDMISKADQISAKTVLLLQKVTDILTEMKLPQTISKTDALIRKLEEKIDHIQTSKISSETEQSLKELKTLLRAINQRKGTLGNLVYDNELYLRLNELLGGAKSNDVLKYFINSSLKNNKK